MLHVPKSEYDCILPCTRSSTSYGDATVDRESGHASWAEVARGLNGRPVGHKHREAPEPLNRGTPPKSSRGAPAGTYGAKFKGTD